MEKICMFCDGKEGKLVLIDGTANMFYHTHCRDDFEDMSETMMEELENNED